MVKFFGEIEKLEDCPAPRLLVMADPKFYTVKYAINVHMVDEKGCLKQVDTVLAMRQWLALKREFERKRITVEVVPPRAELPDLVFTANQSLPLPDGRIVLSKMKSPERSLEVELFHHWYRDRGVSLFIHMENTFESMGDVIWHPGKKLLWGGSVFCMKLPLFF